MRLPFVKVLITGGAGFIGSHLLEFLYQKGFEVTIIDNLSTGRMENISDLGCSYHFIEADLSKKSSSWTSVVRDMDYIFHLASLADIVPSIENPIDYFNSNVMSTINLLSEVDTKKIKKFIYAASSSCYGLPSEFPTSEDDEISPQYPYALTKYMGEELVMHWSKLYGLPAISTRFFNVYGTRSRTSGTYGAVFGVFLAQRLANSPLTIVGDGSQTRDFTYVTDVVEGMYLAAKSDLSGEIFNLGSGKPQSINYLADLIGGAKVYIPKRPGEPDITHSNIDKAIRCLGYTPKVSFEEGVRKVLENINYWASAPVWTPTSISKATQEWFDAFE